MFTKDSQADEPGMLGPICELILCVDDMAGAVAFYRDQLGLAVLFPGDSSDWKQESWVTFETGTCQLALHAGGRWQLGEDAPKFVFAARDITEARQALAKRGIPVSEIRSPAAGVLIVDACDPEGNRFSLEQRG